MRFGVAVLVGVVMAAVFVVEGTDYFDESARFDPALEEESALPDWLLDYNLHAHLVGVIYRPPERTPNLVGLSESQMLMDSLSPGVRASYEGALLEREEAEDAAFAEERLRAWGLRK